MLCSMDIQDFLLFQPDATHDVELVSYGCSTLVNETCGDEINEESQLDHSNEPTLYNSSVSVVC